MQLNRQNGVLVQEFGVLLQVFEIYSIAFALVFGRQIFVSRSVDLS